MAEEKRRRIEEVQVNNNFPGLERLVRLVDKQYPEITRQDVKRYLANDAITQQTKVQQQPGKKKQKGGT